MKLSSSNIWLRGRTLFMKLNQSGRFIGKKIALLEPQMMLIPLNPSSMFLTCSHIPGHSLSVDVVFYLVKDSVFGCWLLFRFLS